GTTAQPTTAVAQSTTAQPAVSGGFQTFGALDERQLTTKADPFGGTPSPVPLATEADIYCYGYIGDPNESMPNSVPASGECEGFYAAGAVRQALGGWDGDLVFIDGGTATGINPGQTYIVVEGDTMVYHPVTKALLGRHYEFRGQIRILCADD